MTAYVVPTRKPRRLWPRKTEQEPKAERPPRGECKGNEASGPRRWLFAHHIFVLVLCAALYIGGLFIPGMVEEAIAQGLADILAGRAPDETVFEWSGYYFAFALVAVPVLALFVPLSLLGHIVSHLANRSCTTLIIVLVLWVGTGYHAFQTFQDVSDAFDTVTPVLEMPVPGPVEPTLAPVVP